ncbi:hypothetical protein EGM70_12125 [Enterobacteriaceae bacterium 89]|nr:hypothetical protein [Enterobacteriaceae bacterium 89]
MTIIYTVEAFERINEMLVFEVEIPKIKLSEIAAVMGWTDEDLNDFIAGIGGWNLTAEQAHSIELILQKEFYQEDLDFQISGGEIP